MPRISPPRDPVTGQFCKAAAGDARVTARPGKAPSRKTRATEPATLPSPTSTYPEGGGEQAADTPRRRATSGPALITRVARAVERELAEIEAIVGKTNNRTDAERRARTLASLARTLSEVTRLREQQQTRRDDDDDAVPRDLDEFRETLARRLEHILAARSARAAGDAEPE